MKIVQALQLSIQSLRGNRLRTMLTVLGVVVGIFSIIVIMTVITMLQSSIENGVSQLNKNTFQIQKFPVVMGDGPGSRDKYRNRKDLTLEDYDRLKELLTMAKYIGAEQWQFGKVVKFGNQQTNPNIQVAGVNLDAVKTNNWNIDYGRELRETDLQYSSDVCLIGGEVVAKVFSKVFPIGQTIRVDGHPFQVIGVIEKQPQLFGESRDNYIVMPITTFQGIYGRRNSSINITVTSESKENYDATIEAAIGYMRTIRKVEAGKDNDFDIFSNESLMSMINNMTDGVKIGALAVSVIALLAAGVGIMNIMLVSVTERTREIGIRKAIGARKSNILLQFLFEAVILCFFGGIIGIMLGIGIGNLAGSFLNAQAAIPYNWVLIGLSLCVVVGIIFGTYPAYKASNLDPIEALRYE
ncbi:MAG: ABC transporter permease [Ignavibacteriaceae bacterium]|nr:ABC transporter permease [Ignavibacteriaceae bacterium]